MNLIDRIFGSTKIGGVSTGQGIVPSTSHQTNVSKSAGDFSTISALGKNGTGTLDVESHMRDVIFGAAFRQTPHVPSTQQTEAPKGVPSFPGREVGKPLVEGVPSVFKAFAGSSASLA